MLGVFVAAVVVISTFVYIYSILKSTESAFDGNTIDAFIIQGGMSKGKTLKMHANYVV